jgi:hypothetical protein
MSKPDLRDIEAVNRRDTDEVVSLCKLIGYGFVMQQAAEAWAKRDPVGAHTVGPARYFTTPCECLERRRAEIKAGDYGGASCDVCMGCGWRLKTEDERGEAK